VRKKRRKKEKSPEEHQAGVVVVEPHVASCMYVLSGPFEVFFFANINLGGFELLTQKSGKKNAIKETKGGNNRNRKQGFPINFL
jgi:hypothetical protein